MARKRRRRSMPAGLRRYWASRRRSNPHRMHARRRTRSRTRTVVRYRTRRANRRHYRRHNPGMRSFMGGFSGSDLLYAGGGALVNGILARSVPQMLVPQYNKGIPGYLLNVAAGGLGAFLIGRFNRRAGQGAWIGMIVAVGQRVISDNFGSGTAAATGGLSGDLDFDLGYYTSDRFPYPQGNGGPYDAFPGSPYLAAPPYPVTSAAAVRAGAAAAAAALPSAATPGTVAAAANLPGAPNAERWTSNWA